MAKIMVGVYSVFDTIFSTGTEGLANLEDDMASIRDMESFSLSTESNVEKQSPVDQGGWGRVLATARAVAASLRGKGSIGDKGNGHVYIILWKDGLDYSTEYSIEFPGGSSVTGNCMLDVRAAPGGDSTNVAALEPDIISDGKPTLVPAPTTPEEGA